MSRGLIFWVLMLIWCVFGILVYTGHVGAYGVVGNQVLLFILFLLLGWQVYGSPIKGQ